MCSESLSDSESAYREITQNYISTGPKSPNFGRFCEMCLDLTCFKRLPSKARRNQVAREFYARFVKENRSRSPLLETKHQDTPLDPDCRINYPGQEASSSSGGSTVPLLRRRRSTSPVPKPTTQPDLNLSIEQGQIHGGSEQSTTGTDPDMAELTQESITSKDDSMDIDRDMSLCPPELPSKKRRLRRRRRRAGTEYNIQHKNSKRRAVEIETHPDRDHQYPHKQDEICGNISESTSSSSCAHYRNHDTDNHEFERNFTNLHNTLETHLRMLQLHLRRLPTAGGSDPAEASISSDERSAQVDPTPALELVDSIIVQLELYLARMRDAQEHAIPFAGLKPHGQLQLSSGSPINTTTVPRHHHRRLQTPSTLSQDPGFEPLLATPCPHHSTSLGFSSALSISIRGFIDTLMMFPGISFRNVYQRILQFFFTE